MFNESPAINQVGTKNELFGRAVVVGGSVAGLAVAIVLSGHFEKVTVIERSILANGVDFPKGVPQSRHPHALLIQGEKILEELFPGFRKSLLDAGVKQLNFGSDLKMRFPDGWLPHYETGLEAIATSRCLLDHTIYQRVAENPKVIFKANSEVTAICTEQAQQTADGSFSGMDEKFQKQLSNELVIPWQTATNEDMRWPNTEGKQELDTASKLIGRYFNLVLKAMPHSARVTDAFFNVQHMIAPPTLLMRPDIMVNDIKTNLSLRFSK